MYKYFKYIIIALTPLISLYFSNNYLLLYLCLSYLFLTMLKPYYSLSLILIYFVRPELLIPTICLTILLHINLLFKKNYVKMSYSYILFIIYIIYALSFSRITIIYITIITCYSLGLYFYFKYSLSYDFYLNKLLIAFMTAIYLYFSKNSYLGYAILIVFYQNKRDLAMLFFVIFSAMLNDYTKIFFYLFFLTISLKKLSIDLLLSIISIYFFKDQYLFYLPIAINMLLYYKEKEPVYNTNTSSNISKYLSLLKSKSNNLDSYDTINEKIKAIIKSYCSNCPMKQKCMSKRRIDFYHYLMYELTSNMKPSSEIDYFIYNCEYKKMMDEIPKINFNLQSCYNTVNETFSILTKENTIKDDLFERLKKYSLKSVDYINSFKMKLSFNEYIIPIHLQRILKNNDLSVNYTGNNTYIVWSKPKCKIKAESIILSKGGGYIAGDNCLIKASNNTLYAALSDGMGSGLKAYEASKALLKRLEGLISLPYDDEQLIKLLTELCHLSLYTSSYATLDFFSANLSKKKAKLFKIASAPTLLIRNNKIKEFTTKTLPIDFDSVIDLYEINLEKNDIILMMSDGAFDFSNIKSLYAYILSISYLDPDKLVYNIAKYIFNESNKKLHDDTSILAIKVY